MTLSRWERSVGHITKPQNTDVYGRPSVIIIRTCDVCGVNGPDVEWVRDPDGKWWSLCRDDNPDFALEG